MTTNRETTTQPHKVTTVETAVDGTKTENEIEITQADLEKGVRFPTEDELHKTLDKLGKL